MHALDGTTSSNKRGSTSALFGYAVSQVCASTDSSAAAHWRSEIPEQMSGRLER